jgi:hypothetical protein
MIAGVAPSGEGALGLFRKTLSISKDLKILRENLWKAGAKNDFFFQVFGRILVSGLAAPF